MRFSLFFEMRISEPTRAPEIYLAHLSGRTSRYVCTPTALTLDDDRTAGAHGYRDRLVGRLPISRADLDDEQLDEAMARRPVSTNSRS